MTPSVDIFERGSSPLAIARELRARGLSVIPIPRAGGGPRPDGKVNDGKLPAYGFCWGAYQSRHATDAELVAWFPDGVPMNVAIVTGAISGIVVVDLDADPARRWFCGRHPYTAWQTATGKGYHLFYRHPGVLVRNRARIATPDGQRLAIDVRADGGFVIAAGSEHANGSTYAQAGNWSEPREALPVFWPGWLARPAPPSAPPPRTPRPTGDVSTRARAYLAAIPLPEIGAGSDEATFSAACRLVRGFALSEADAAALLWEWCGNRDGWTYNWVVAKVASAGRHQSGEAVGGLL